MARALRPWPVAGRLLRRPPAPRRAPADGLWAPAPGAPGPPLPHSAPGAPRWLAAAASTETERLSLSLVTPSRVHDVVNPRLVAEAGGAPGWVSDVGRFLGEDERRRVDALCQEVHDAWRVEVAVVVLDGLPADVRPAGFAAALLNYWGVGDARLHTGLLALLLLGQRRLEARTGYGAGRVLGPEVLRALQEERALPHLRAGANGAALEALLGGVREAMDRDGPKHWRRATAPDPPEPNKHGFGGGQTPVDEFLPGGRAPGALGAAGGRGAGPGGGGGGPAGPSGAGAG